MSIETKQTITQQCIDTIRVLSADMVQAANSGHPGMPMGMAPIAHIMWNKIMKYSPSQPRWMNRDRFVLSNGHGCALLYSMLHLTGYHLTMDDLKGFRQMGSKTPGHPENILTEGVEVTTGPLGQGVANAVGMAMAEAHLAANFNKPGFELINNYTYVFCGDGCLQEGVSAEAASLAGHLGLGKLIMIYDDNRITIDGNTELSFSEDVPKRFEAYGWHTITVENGDTNLDGIEAAIRAAQHVTDKPSIISVKTTIGYASKLAGTAEAHGSPLGEAELRAVKQKLGFDPEKKFHVDAAVYEAYKAHVAEGEQAAQAWAQLLDGYATEYPQLAADFKRRVAGEFPAGWKDNLPVFTPQDKPDATRNLSGVVLNKFAAVLPEMIGGSADLTGSVKTQIKGSSDFQKGAYAGRYFRFGVREHGMAAIGNGMVAYGAVIPFTATFLNFIEYCFPAVRLSALSHFGQLYIMTHDSIGLGEDGPTHQPVEALSLCRATPDLNVFRPADGNEVVGSYVCALEERQRPSVLSLTRQNLPQLHGSSAAAVAKGAYVLTESRASRPTPSPI